MLAIEMTGLLAVSYRKKITLELDIVTYFDFIVIFHVIVPIFLAKIEGEMRTRLV